MKVAFLSRLRVLNGLAQAQAKQARQGLWNRLVIAFLCLSLLCALYPSDLPSIRSDFNAAQADNTSISVQMHGLVQGTEDYGRHLNSVVAVALPLLLRDGVGLVQMVYVALAGMITTHVSKRLLNNVVIDGTRLGERPWGPQSKHNSPSGHSSLAAEAAAFVCRRYGWRWAFLLMPIVFLTMWARVDLNMHTLSAVLAGMLLGFAVGFWFSSPKESSLIKV